MAWFLTLLNLKLYIYLKQNFPNPEIVLLPVTTAIMQEGPSIIKPVAKKGSMRWLGVYFDPRLSFVDHAGKMTTKGRKAASGVSMLVDATKGVEAVIMRKAIHACILPILTYGAPAWWPERTRTNREGRTIQNDIDNNCQKLDKTQNAALRFAGMENNSNSCAPERSRNPAYTPHS